MLKDSLKPSKGIAGVMSPRETRAWKEQPPIAQIFDIVRGNVDSNLLTPEEMTSLLESGKVKPDACRNGQGQTALHAAAWNSHRIGLIALHRAGADLEARDNVILLRRRPPLPPLRPSANLSRLPKVISNPNNVRRRVDVSDGQPCAHCHNPMVGVAFPKGFTTSP